jgi:Enoyl-(Acyl carrier protein) reductase
VLEEGLDDAGAAKGLRFDVLDVVDGGRHRALDHGGDAILHLVGREARVRPDRRDHRDGLVHVLANELRGRNVTVNAVAPGPVATELFLKDKTPAQIEQFTKLAPLERRGQPADIANVVSFLAGPGGSWVNGQVLRANGGFA